MRLPLFAAALSLTLFLPPSYSQVAEKKDPVQEKLIQDAAQKGLPLSASVSVNGNVSVEAVLLPPIVTRHVFSKAVSDRFAAVELTISNRSHDAALVVHSIFIDYSRWLLSGTSANTVADCAPRAVGASTNPQARPNLPACGNPLESWQAETKPNQIAAAEYRLARGELLDRQQWTVRNVLIRSLELAGSVAAGYVFAFSETGISKGVAAYNGNFLPAVRNLIPDSSIDQINRVSDLGFRVNKVIPKDSSDIVVAFFPIDRFLPPGIKKLFMKSPAIFFVPHASALDPEASKLLADYFRQFQGPEAQATDFGGSLRTALRTGVPNEATQFLDRISLNNVRVIVGGAMTVDVDTVGASIESVTFDEADLAMLWSEPGIKKGTISGRYLSGGTPKILEADRFGITDVAAIAQGSDDGTLRFQFNATKAISAGTKLTFRVDKKDKSGKPVEGASFLYVVKDFVPVAPAVEKVARSGDNLTITGKRFFSTEANPLTVTLQPGSVSGVDAVAIKKFDRTPTEIKIDLAPLALKPACWTPVVSAGTMEALGSTAFAQPPTPKIASAKRSGARVVVTGDQFVNLSNCGKALTFEIAQQAAGSAFAAVTNLTVVSPKEVSFDLPTSPANGTFKMRVLVGGVEADNRNIE